MGFAEHEWRLIEKRGTRGVKRVLYTYRVLLTGIHLMRTSEVEANLVRLNQDHHLAHIDELIERKKTMSEDCDLAGNDLAFHEGEYHRLRGELEEAGQASKLPGTPSAGPELNDLLIRLRLSSLDHAG